MLSSHRLWPASCSARVGFMLPPWPAHAAVRIPRPASNGVADLADREMRADGRSRQYPGREAKEHRPGANRAWRLPHARLQRLPPAGRRVIAPHVGGGFGGKLNVYAEEAIALAIARRLGRR
jgi:CO/xanthine dehydrogenase Mo-binding subunit